MDMNNKNHVTTLPKRGLKTRSYSIDMNERDLEKLSKSELIKLLLKQKKSKKVHNHDDLLNNDPFKDEVAQKPAKPTRKPLPPILQVEEKEHITNVPSSKIKELK